MREGRKGEKEGRKIKNREKGAGKEKERENRLILSYLMLNSVSGKE